ncbi:MAG TPA: penicillin-binding transpeptidase domain-containing protein, partial [Candidatus Sulfotelmatobacter sp.]|nr:penicillin-binding transpeptidase domain-containing protein [Candidatus Sulfotelmatobacter sp.]
SYDATPLEMASAYTVFTNNGQRINPIMIRSVRDANGDVLDNYQPQKSQVLDPRVSYVITDMLQGVINNGTAAGPAGVRARKFTAPAAGKTGSSHDGWFAGFTSNLLCIIWVGYDDYSDIHLSGSAIALPIWTEFMKRAVDLPNYSDVKPFSPPQGVVELSLDKATNQIATPACPDDYTTAFIEGTQPTQTCEQTAHGNVFQRIFGIEPKPTPTPAASNTTGNTPPTPAPQQPTGTSQNTVQTQPADPDKKKKGFWGRIFGGSKDENKDDNKGTRPAATPTPDNRPH